ncbi:hypothetical protein EGW08_019193 [Elysia chlorotica]|uniref:type I protein arginine methyltransferase n=1 Tax=Elysia chlorotica TaxID=188477 RepID=A0A433SUU3_ELYCH|nr:hypothetical protein EGW08_019193 [Elysia chlorotica]
MATKDQCQQDETSTLDEKQDEGGYFNSYNDLSVHQLMLKDRPRTLAYRRFFETHRDIVKDKVVLDVGAGTGILSLFAAVAGARKVYAVEASAVASLCREIVAENGLDGTIQVIHSPVEEVELPTQVDLIVSEWMGFYLLHESMLDSVIAARDKFLRPGGLMVPAHARIYMAPVDMTEHFQDRSDEWSNIYGFDFSPVASAINRNEVVQPLVESLSPDKLRAEPRELLSIDLGTVTVEEVRKFTNSLEFHIPFETKIHGFACWFDVDFRVKMPEAENISDNLTNRPSCKLMNETGDAKCESLSSTGSQQHTSTNNSTKQPEETVSLRTGPNDPPTHWKQTVIFLPQTMAVAAETSLACRVKMSQDVSGNKRQYNITVALTDGADDEDEEGDMMMMERNQMRRRTARFPAIAARPGVV